jgi:hypothetical protein
MTEPLTRAMLDRTQCATPGCTHEDHRLIYLHSACHPSVGCRVAYDMARGVVVVRCRRCAKLVAEIAVAP